jgi:hypothetical protein
MYENHKIISESRWIGLKECILCDKNIKWELYKKSTILRLRLQKPEISCFKIFIYFLLIYYRFY